MSNYIRGRAREYVVRDTFRKKKYKAERTAGSHGLWDVHAVNSKRHVLVQVKLSISGKPSKDDNWKAFEKFKVPPNTRKEVWVFTRGVKQPKVIRL